MRNHTRIISMPNTNTKIMGMPKFDFIMLILSLGLIVVGSIILGIKHLTYEPVYLEEVEVLCRGATSQSQLSKVVLVSETKKEANLMELMTGSIYIINKEVCDIHRLGIKRLVK